MKTHELENELISLAKALKLGPNINVGQLPDLLRGNGESVNDEMAFGISTLTHLLKFSKQDWLAFIQEHNLPINYNTRDSARNVIGKIMHYLESNEEAIN
jgi:hypothetical protein